MYLYYVYVFYVCSPQDESEFTFSFEASTLADYRNIINMHNAHLNTQIHI